MLLARLVLGLSCVLAVGGMKAAGADIEFVTPEFPWAVADKPYNPPPLQVRSSGTCPLGGVGFTLVSGSVPPGIQFSKLGYFSGTPIRTGTWEFAVRVSNGCTWTARHYTILVTGAPILTVTPTRIELGPAEQRNVHVSATWPRLNYSVATSASWLNAEPERGATPREGSGLSADEVRISIDPVGLKPGRYSASLIFSAWQAANHPTVQVQLLIPDSAP